MIRIRRGVFETNSSSLHAIVVGNYSKELNTNQVVNFGLNHYGWNHPCLAEEDELASYLYTACCAYYGRDMQAEIRKLLPQDVDAHFAVPKFHELEYNGEKHYYLDNGSVDHVNELKPWLDQILSDKDMLARYLFDSGSYTVITNDNEEHETLPEEGIDDMGNYCFIKGN